MELRGKIIKLLPLQTGTGKNGIWKKQEYVIETSDKIPRKLCFSLWGDKIEQFQLTEGDQAEISFDLESREYNGRWYTEAKAWKCSKTSDVRNSDDQPPDFLKDTGTDPMEVMPF